jgi:hypothetical protein
MWAAKLTLRHLLTKQKKSRSLLNGFLFFYCPAFYDLREILLEPLVFISLINPLPL